MPSKCSFCWGLKHGYINLHLLDLKEALCKALQRFEMSSFPNACTQLATPPISDKRIWHKKVIILMLSLRVATDNVIVILGKTSTCKKPEKDMGNIESAFHSLFQSIFCIFILCLSIKNMGGLKRNMIFTDLKITFDANGIM